VVRVGLTRGKGSVRQKNFQESMESSRDKKERGEPRKVIRGKRALVTSPGGEPSCAFSTWEIAQDSI